MYICLILEVTLPRCVAVEINELKEVVSERKCVVEGVEAAILDDLLDEAIDIAGLERNGGKGENANSNIGGEYLQDPSSAAHL